MVFSEELGYDPGMSFAIFKTKQTLITFRRVGRVPTVSFVEPTLRRLHAAT